VALAGKHLFGSCWPMGVRHRTSAQTAFGDGHRAPGRIRSILFFFRPRVGRHRSSRSVTVPGCCPIRVRAHAGDLRSSGPGKTVLSNAPLARGRCIGLCWMPARLWERSSQPFAVEGAEVELGPGVVGGLRQFQSKGSGQADCVVHRVVTWAVYGCCDSWPPEDLAADLGKARSARPARGTSWN